MSAAYAMVRHRFASFAGTFVAVALGVAVLAVSATLYLSSQPQAPARYDHAPVLIQSPRVGTNDYGEDERRAWTTAEATDLAQRLAALPGVTAAVADPSFYVQRLERGRATGDATAARIDGHAWSSAALGGYRLTAGRAPARAGEVVVANAAPGQRLDVLTARGPETWTVTGTADGPGFYLADADAMQRASGVRIIGLTSTADEALVADAARALTGPAGDVVAGADRNRLEPEGVTRIRWIGAQLLIALVTLGAFATVFVVSSTCALSAAQRRRELGLLRAVGATPSQVRLQMYAETALISLLAGLVGAPLGAAAAPLLAAPMVGAGLEPAGFTATWQPAALVGAALLGVIVALCGVAVAARRASRVPPLDALREAAADPRPMTASRWIGGLLGTAGGVVLLATMPAMPLETQTTAGMGAAMLLIGAAALLAPILIIPLVRVIAWPARGTAAGMLVREGTLTGVRRVAATAAPVLATVGLTVLLTGTIATIEGAVGIEESAEYPATTLLVPDGTPGLSEKVTTAQRGDAELPTRVLVSHPGGITGYHAAGVTGAPEGAAPPSDIPAPPSDAAAAPSDAAVPPSDAAVPPSDAAAPPADDAAPPADDDAAPAEGAVLHTETADELGVRAGGTIALRWPDGTTADMPVLAVEPDAKAPITLPRDLVRAHDPDALTSLVVLSGDPAPGPGAEAVAVRDFVQREIDEEGRLVDLFLWALIGLTAGYTGIAVANTLLMATAARRPEFRAMRLAGAGTGQVLRVVSAESLLATGAGALLGAVVAGGSLFGMRAAVENELGQPVALVIPWGAGTAVTAACAILAVLAAALPVVRRP
ncbi:FtsX-like permease family protein [Actinoplanes sp. NPDC051861]|uniref:ABC transporter permease n=1 Tax=Actinoplanes sp. NPDC051861 TaxID=3155170 RepID=UPI00342978E1